MRKVILVPSAFDVQHERVCVFGYGRAKPVCVGDGGSRLVAGNCKELLHHGNVFAHVQRRLFAICMEGKYATVLFIRSIVTLVQ